MKIIHNRIIPFGKDFLAINLFGVIFTKGYVNDRLCNHEYIHTLQQREMLFVGFYLWYLVEWLVRIICCGSYIRAYQNISFEREAYANDHDLGYPNRRKSFGWTRYLRAN